MTIISSKVASQKSGYTLDWLTVSFTADSDAIITKGIIAILIRLVQTKTLQDILEANTDFIDEIGLLKSTYLPTPSKRPG
jgi:sulfur transfer protein SufE